MYKFILLDIDNTILDFDKTEKNSFKKIIESFSIEYNSDVLNQYKKINTSLWKLLEQGKTTKDIVLNTRFSDFFKLYNIDVNGAEVEKQFRQYLNESSDLIPNAKNTLLELKRRGKKLYTASNGVYSTQVQRLTNAGILDLFDDMFISDKIGFEKPSIYFFEYCLNNIKDVERDKIIMVGDNISSDIQGALNIGIDSCYCRYDKDIDCLNASYTINDISELLDIVK
ncbi:MAG TPA: noncanonical pyrimidine nucleotidase, YjjG family [Clostridiales bacterium]|nr:noncanonical pyrimidine nucleotidase, YjjG family [Clostridiales bacterium]